MKHGYDINRSILLFLFIALMIISHATYSFAGVKDPLLKKFVELYNEGNELHKQEQIIIDTCKKNKDKKNSICKEIILLMQNNLNEEKFNDILYLTSLYKKIAEKDDALIEKILYIEGSTYMNLNDIEGVKRTIAELDSINAESEYSVILSEEVAKAENILHDLDGCWLSLDYYRLFNRVPAIFLNIENIEEKDTVSVSIPHGCHMYKCLSEGLDINEALKMKEIYPKYCFKFNNDSIFIAWATGDADVGNAYLSDALRQVGRNYAAKTAGEMAKIHKGYSFGDRLSSNLLGGVVELGLNSLADNMIAVKKKIVIIELRLARVNNHTMKGVLKYNYKFIKDGVLAGSEEFSQQIVMMKYLDIKTYPVAEIATAVENEYTFIAGVSTEKWFRRQNWPTTLRAKAMSDKAMHEKGYEHTQENCVICDPKYITYLGLQTETITPDNTKKKIMEILDGKGVRIKAVDEEYIGYTVDTIMPSSFKKNFGAGRLVWLKEGDIIIDINGIPCNSPEDYHKIVNMHKPGDIAYIRYIHKQRERVVKTRFIYRIK